jgi:ATP-dependent Clp protease ATP-binding subunit ClpA
MLGMFEQFSLRAKRVIFLARMGAGRRGAPRIDVDDLLAALLLEDQNKTSEALGETGEAGTLVCLKPHQRFLPTDLATSLLEEIQALTRSQPIADSTDMSISAELGTLLTLAIELRMKLKCQEVTPLHLLAVLLTGEDSRLQRLRDAGITEEKVLSAIRSGDHQ